jgi:hypothetical protein
LAGLRIGDRDGNGWEIKRAGAVCQSRAGPSIHGFSFAFCRFKAVDIRPRFCDDYKKRNQYRKL